MSFHLHSEQNLPKFLQIFPSARRLHCFHLHSEQEFPKPLGIVLWCTRIVFISIRSRNYQRAVTMAAGSRNFSFHLHSEQKLPKEQIAIIMRCSYFVFSSPFGAEFTKVDLDYILSPFSSPFGAEIAKDGVTAEALAECLFSSPYGTMIRLVRLVLVVFISIRSRNYQSIMINPKLAHRGSEFSSPFGAEITKGHLLNPTKYNGCIPILRGKPHSIHNASPLLFSKPFHPSHIKARGKMTIRISQWSESDHLITRSRFAAFATNHDQIAHCFVYILRLVDMRQEIMDIQICHFHLPTEEDITNASFIDFCI